MSDQINASSYIFVFNKKDELLLQLRSKDEASYPLHYDFSAAGEIEKSEDPKTAAHRELMEELGIQASTWG